MIRAFSHTVFVIASLHIFCFTLSCSKKASSEDAFSVSGVDPLSGRAGDTLQVNGSNFNTGPGIMHVSVDGFDASLTSVTSKAIKFIVPVSTSTGSIAVSSRSGKTVVLDSRLTLLPKLQAPVILDIFPPSAKPGDVITIKASPFPNHNTEVGVTFDGLYARVLSLNDSSLQVIVPGGSTGTNVILSSRYTGASKPYPYPVTPISNINSDGRIYFTATDAVRTGSFSLFRGNDSNTIPGGALLYNLEQVESNLGYFYSFSLVGDLTGNIYYTTGNQNIIQYKLTQTDPQLARIGIPGTIIGRGPKTFFSGYSSSFENDVYFGIDSVPSIPLAADPKCRVQHYQYGQESSQTIYNFLPEPSLVFAVGKSKLYYITAMGELKASNLSAAVPRKQADGKVVSGIRLKGTLSYLLFNVKVKSLNSYLLNQPGRGDSLIIMDRDPTGLSISKILLFAPASPAHDEVLRTLYDATNFPYLTSTIDGLQWAGNKIYFTFSQLNYSALAYVKDDGSSQSPTILYSKLEPFGQPRTKALLYINASEK